MGSALPRERGRVRANVNDRIEEERGRERASAEAPLARAICTLTAIIRVNVQITPGGTGSNTASCTFDITWMYSVQIVPWNGFRIRDLHVDSHIGSKRANRNAGIGSAARPASRRPHPNPPPQCKPLTFAGAACTPAGTTSERARAPSAAIPNASAMTIASASRSRARDA